MKNKTKFAEHNAEQPNEVIMKNANNPKWNANKGKVSEMATPESRMRGTVASHASAKKKRAMRDALDRVMSIESSDVSSGEMEFNKPGIKNEDIDGYTEIALSLRLHARKNANIALKLAELLGAANKNDEPDPD